MRRATLKCKVDDSIDRFAIDAFAFSQLDLPSISYLQTYRIGINGRDWHGKLTEPAGGVQRGNVLLVSNVFAEQFDVSRRSRATISVSQADQIDILQYKLIEDHEDAKPIMEGLEVQPGDICRLKRETIKIIEGSGYITKETRLENAEPSKGHSKPKIHRLGHQSSQNDADGFTGLAGMDDVIKKMRNTVLMAFNNPDLAVNHLGSPLNGVLIYGPKGVGRSTVVEATAEEANATMLPIPATAAADATCIRDIYKKASSMKQRSVISVDPIDDIIPAEGRGSPATAILQECLDNSQMDEQVITLAVARKLDQLPRSLLRARRLEQVIEIRLPNRQQRVELFRFFLRGVKVHSAIDYQVLADKTETYTGADIQSLVREAGMYAMIEANTGKDGEISTDNILDIIKARDFP